MSYLNIAVFCVRRCRFILCVDTSSEETLGLSKLSLILFDEVRLGKYRLAYSLKVESTIKQFLGNRAS